MDYESEENLRGKKLLVGQHCVGRNLGTSASSKLVIEAQGLLNVVYL